MIKSKFLTDIFNLLQDQKEYELIKNQINCLLNIKYEYTGMGLFIHFEYSGEVNKYRIKKEDSIFGEIYIESSEILEHALCHLFLKDGIIDYLEIWSVSGNYPQKELDNYILTQDWLGSQQRKLISS